MRRRLSDALLVMLVFAMSAAAVAACVMGVVVVQPAAAAHRALLQAPPRAVAVATDQAFVVPYLAWNGQRRECVVLLPRDYRPGDPEGLPCIIDSHARGVTAQQTAKLWGDLPSTERFMVICAGSTGRTGRASSWSYPGQIADLMDLPDVIARAMAGVRIDSSRLYAIGVSMGGMEALSLLARYPDRLAAVASFDGVADLAAYYGALPASSRARQQALLAKEVGGSPRHARFRYALRSPLTFAATLATCRVPINVWWSSRDRSVRYQETRQTGKLCRLISAMEPTAPLFEVATDYAHGFALRDDPRRVLDFLRPGGRWLVRQSRPPTVWAYTSWLPDVTVWGYRFLTDSDLRRMWHVTVMTDQVVVRAPAPLTVQIPWTDRRAVTVVIDDQLRQVWPQGGMLTLTFAAGDSTARILR